MNIVETVEALLFVADGPVPAESLARVLGLTEGQIVQAVELLRDRLSERSGLDVVELAGGYQLGTKPEHAAAIGAFLKPQRQRLSQSMLEVLAIVAYKQPITVVEIERVRGVQSDYGLRILLERRFVREVGRKPSPGRPVLYGTTPQFLHQFHLNSLDDLPSVEGSAPSLRLPPESGV